MDHARFINSDASRSVCRILALASVAGGERRPQRRRAPSMTHADSADIELLKDIFDEIFDEPEEPEEQPRRKVRRISGKTREEATAYGSPDIEGARSMGVQVRCRNQLRRWGVPPLFLALIAMVLQATQGLQSPVNAVEGFSGVGRIDTAFKEMGYAAHGFDIDHHRCFESINSDEGFCTLIYWILCLSPLGLAHFATVCSTWVWVSRSSTGRSAVKPEGFDTEAVRSANCMVERTVLLLLLCAARGCHFILEQPASSVMEFMPCVQHLKRCIGSSWTCIFTYMGMFGHDCWKPTHLYSSTPKVLALKRKLDKNSDYANGWSSSKCVKVRCDTRGFIHVDGAEGLKQSQEYPKEYGDEVYKLWDEQLKHETVNDSKVEDVPADTYEKLVEAVGWKWGNLNGPCAFMHNKDA